MKTHLTISLVAVSLLAASVASTSKATAGQKEDALLQKQLSSYQSWKRVTPKALHLPEATATLCAAPNAALPNPHRQFWFNVFVNKKGEKAMQKPKSPVFPVGTMIVKEKLKEESSTVPSVRTVMIKRSRGFDKDAGDWEYVVVGLKGGITRDSIIREGVHSLGNCRSCHEKAKDCDYVFRTYLPSKTVDGRGKKKDQTL